MRERVAGLRSVLEDLRDAVGRETEVQTLVTLMRIAEQPEGIPMKDLQDALGIKPSSMSRNIGRLGNTGYRNGKGTEVPGLGLIDTWENPEDRRTKLVRLSGGGKALIRRVLDKVGATR
jgi:DNA-binding MarR family transcriptional regulator